MTRAECQYGVRVIVTSTWGATCSAPPDRRVWAQVLRSLLGRTGVVLRRDAVLRACTPNWSATPEVACRARVARGAGANLSALEMGGFVERRSTSSHSQWRLTERGAAQLRDLPAEVAASRRGE